MNRGPTTRIVVLGIVSGLLYWGAFPTLGTSALAFVALVPLLVGVRGHGIASGVLAGWVAGTVACNGLTSASILAALLRAGHPFGLAAAEAFVVPQLCGAVWFAAFGGYAAALGRRQPTGAWDVLVLPAAWVAGELARSRLGGMPWVLLGHSQASSPTLLQVADGTGAFGVSFVVALVNVGVAVATMRRPPRAALVVAVLLVIASVGYGRVQLARWERPGGLPLDVALVQGAIPDGWRESLPRQRDAIARYRTLVERAARAGPALVVLPENAVSISPETNPEVVGEIARALAPHAALLLIGGPRAVSTAPGRAGIRNSAYLLDARGTVAGVYDKMRLVPFGETSPPWLAPRTQNYSPDYSPGDAPVMLHAAGATIATAICWEGIYAESVARRVLSGATLLASLSNDDWFGGRAAVDQHFQATLFRAIETRRWLVRATNSGVTAIVDPRGVAVVAPRNEPTVLSGRVTLETTMTPYVRFGDAFAWLCCAVALGGMARRGPPRRSD